MQQMQGPSYDLNDLINNLSYPTSGDQVVNQCHINLPADFCNEIRSDIQGQQFNSAEDLRQWFSENLTTHMAGLLGGATVQELIGKGKVVKLATNLIL